jgi:adenylate kinase
LQRVSPNEEGAEQIEQSAHLILNKGVKALTFNENRRFVLNLIGNTGSGKGTQGELLSKLYGIPHISPGNLFRQEFRSESKLAWMMKVYYKEHYPNYFPEEISIGIMTRRLAKVDCQRGFIFDGFPKTEIQTQVASEIFIRNHDFHIPLFMDVSENDILDRLSGRSICNECGHEVRKFDENPWPGFCPIEAKNGRMVELSHRPEDTDPASIERKLSLFRENIGTVLGKIGKRDPICSFQLDNLTTPREVLHQLNNSIQQRLENLWEHENNDRHEQNLFT